MCGLRNTELQSGRAVLSSGSLRPPAQRRGFLWCEMQEIEEAVAAFDVSKDIPHV